MVVVSIIGINTLTRNLYRSLHYNGIFFMFYQIIFYREPSAEFVHILIMNIVYLGGCV